MVGYLNIAYFYIFHIDIDVLMDFQHGRWGGGKHRKVKREKHNFFFAESFRCFHLNKSVLETKETKHADSQLCFAPKNIKIYLVVFENEFFEVE